MTAPRKVVVVGGGIAGLSAARLLATSPQLQVTVLEAQARFGGKIETRSFGGRNLDVGAEALLARVPAPLQLCRELGLEPLLEAPSTDRAYVWRDQLRPLPPRLLAGAPGGAKPLIDSGILSPRGLLRCVADVVRPSQPLAQDVSIGALVRKRLGDEVSERLIDPLLGGIHAGNCDELSVQACAPQLVAALAGGHGLVRGLRSMAAANPPAGPTFLTLSGGLGVIIEALVTQTPNVSLRTNAKVEGIVENTGGALDIQLGGGEIIRADDVILALPAHVAASLLQNCNQPAAAELAQIPYASVATIGLAYAPQAIPPLPEGSGFLVQRGGGHIVSACTWSSAKWPHMAGEQVVLKCSTGRSDDQRHRSIEDDTLITAVRADLRAMMGIESQPLQAEVFRFENALPQYLVGHVDRVKRIEEALARQPHISLCGAAYHGVGVGACVRDGQMVAQRILDSATRSEPSQPILI